MADQPIPKPTPKPPEINAIAAAKQQTSLMAGGGINPASPPANPASPGCGTGKPTDQAGGEQSDPNAPMPGGCGNVIQTQSGTRNHPISSGLKGILSKSAGSINANFVVTSGGQYPAGEGPHKGSVRHNNQGSAAGSLGAADGYFKDCSTGRILSTSNSADRSRLAQGLGTAYQGGATGLGSNYMSGMGGAGRDQLFHIGGGTDRVWGGDTAFLQSAKAGKEPAAVAGGANSAGGNTNGSDCGGGNGGGCAPINSAAPAVASSVNAGQGLNPASALTGGLQQVASTVTGGLGAGVQQALSAVTGGAGSIMNVASSISGLTAPAMNMIQNMGGGILPSLTGVIPSGISSIIGGGSLTGMIQNAAGSIIQQGMPQLGGFTSILGSAIGAAASGGNMMNAVLGSATQIFGNSLGNMQNLTGAIPNIVEPDDPDMGLGGNDYTDILQNRIDRNVKLIRTSPGDVVSDLVNADAVDGFSSLHNNYNSLVTQGFGSMSNSVVDLGNDLTNLGKLGDMTDVFNLGTPQQFARQLIENGFGFSTTLVPLLIENGLSLENLYTNNNSQDVYSILESINDPGIINDVKTHFEVADTLQFETLADFINPEKIFPTSYEYNQFEYLEELGPTLSLYNMGQIKTLGQFGKLLSSLETVEGYDDLLAENTVIRQTESAEYLDGMVFASKFGFEGPTVADFIGTAAGYVHSSTLPAMATLLEQIEQSGHLDEFHALMQLMINTLNGDYTTTTIDVPPTNDYTFGSYTTLDDATAAIVGAIESELQYLKDDLENVDHMNWLRIQYLETYHWESARFLEHEKRMRRLYGIDIGDPQRQNSFMADGVRTSFELEEDKSSKHTVYVNDVFQAKNQKWTYNANNNSIVFITPPAHGAIVSIVYNVNTFRPETTNADGWQFAASLEQYAMHKGYGNTSDYLNRVASNDIHGQRINAILRQARNKERLSDLGVIYPNFDTITDASNNNSIFNYTGYTGIWTDNINRAAEIQVQNFANVKSFRQYIIQNYAKNKHVMQADLDILLQNITRQLIFYVNDSIAVTQLMVDLYQSNQNKEIYQQNRSDLFIPYSEEFSTDGFIIGPYREIVSEIGRKEGIKNDVFNQPLSAETIAYFKELNFDISLMITIIQRIFIVNISLSLGISEGDVQNVFGIQSVFKKILQNIADNY